MWLPSTNVDGSTDFTIPIYESMGASSSLNSM